MELRFFSESSNKLEPVADQGKLPNHVSLEQNHHLDFLTTMVDVLHLLGNQGNFVVKYSSVSLKYIV